MYVQGFLLAVPEDKKDEYREMADKAWSMFQGFGAIDTVEAWEDSVEDGKVTDFRMATKAEPGEKIVFSWIIWPDKATCEDAAKRMTSGEGTEDMPTEMPFDGMRMMWGGFEPIFAPGSTK